jgi:phosphatidylglycerophosphate synthase
MRPPALETLRPVRTRPARTGRSGAALLYLPDAASVRLAARSIAGRTVTVRNLVAALRAGASIIAVPAALRDRAVERALAHMPALAAAVRWLEPGSRLPAGPPDQPWLLVPAASLVHTRILRNLIEGAATSDRVIMTTSALDAAAVAVLPRAIVSALWSRLASGSPMGPDLARLLEEWGAQPRASTDPIVTVRDAAASSRAAEALFDDLGIEADTGLDRCFHRRCSRWITRLLVNTPVTPSHVTIASLAVGSAAIRCFWRATPLSAVWGVILYAIATILDHADGEIARLTYQESQSGANLDWTVDTIIHAGLVLGMAVAAGGPLMQWVGLFSALGVTLSALFARYLPLGSTATAGTSGVLKALGSRDLVYLLLLSFVAFRWLAPSLLPPLAVVVGIGSQAYWIACLARILKERTSP